MNYRKNAGAKQPGGGSKNDKSVAL